MMCRSGIVTCQARAAADGRVAVGRFTDPVSIRMLRAPERAAVERVRSAAEPQRTMAWLRYRMLADLADILAARTVAIDDAVRAAANPQLVVLGAGLDARAWRMTELAWTVVFEVDHPAAQSDKRERIGDADPAAASVRFVPVEFGSAALESALEAAGQVASEPTTWIWEGGVRYLRKPHVERMLRGIAARSAPGSRVIVGYTTRTVHSVLLAPWGVRLWLTLAGAAGAKREERIRSLWTPAQIAALCTAHGLDIDTDEDLLGIARALEIPYESPEWLANTRVAVADLP
ncbi:class I SAM-dependent methyltransferase [Nocardia sp. NPDC127526]|uniref:class I SAM-dependent methyltransferase n=1 Tax=Nocardia sp. NPDC127526 TaxID=3345393 RepID=UPI00363654F0